MKKIIVIIGLVALFAGLSSCTKNQTALSSETISTKVKVYGYIEYTTYNKSGNATDNEFTGTADLFYRSASASPKPGFNHRTIEVKDGAFDLELGCPAGESLEVKVQASTFDDTYVSGATQTAYFFGTTTKTVDCGNAAYIKVKMGPTVYPEDPDAN